MKLLGVHICGCCIVFVCPCNDILYGYSVAVMVLYYTVAMCMCHDQLLWVMAMDL
jgi:hypothetical protein